MEDKTLIVFCDIVGTITGHEDKEHKEKRCEFIKHFTTLLSRLSVLEGCNRTVFSFCSTNDADIENLSKEEYLKRKTCTSLDGVAIRMEKIYPFLRAKGIKLGRCACGEGILFPIIQNGELTEIVLKNPKDFIQYAIDKNVSSIPKSNLEERMKLYTNNRVCSKTDFVDILASENGKTVIYQFDDSPLELMIGKHRLKHFTTSYHSINPHNENGSTEEKIGGIDGLNKSLEKVIAEKELNNDSQQE